MRKPIWSWENTLARLGLVRRKGRKGRKHREGRSLRHESLEPRQLLASVVQATGFHTNQKELLVDYEVFREASAPFDVAIYSTSDGVNAEKRLTAEHVDGKGDLAIGPHRLALAPPALKEWAKDMSLIVRLEPTDDPNAAPDWLLFVGGTVETEYGTLEIRGAGDDRACETPMVLNPGEPYDDPRDAGPAFDLADSRGGGERLLLGNPLVIDAGAQAGDGNADTFTLSRVGSALRVVVNGATQDYTITNYDSITVNGSSDVDQITVNSLGTDFGYQRNVTLNGNGNADTAWIFDSSSDDVYSDEVACTLTIAAGTASAYWITANGIPTVNVYSMSGNDIGYLYGESGDDAFSGFLESGGTGQNVGRMTTSTFMHRLKYFDEVHAFAVEGGLDVASLEDSDGADSYSAYLGNSHTTPSVAYMMRTGVFYHRAKSFDEVHGYASYGGTDNATLYDGPWGDTFISNPSAGAGVMQGVDSTGTAFFHRAKSFESVKAYSNKGGVDRAYLLGFETDTVNVGSNPAALSRTGLQHEAHNFEEIRASQCGFSDNDLLDGVWQALNLPAVKLVVAADIDTELTSLTADSNLVGSLQGLEDAAQLGSLTLVPSDFAKLGWLSTLSPISGLTNLKNLTLQHAGLVDAEVTGLPSSIECLDLRYNDINVVPTAVANLPSLQALYVYGNPLTSTLRTGLANLAGKLMSIDIPADHPEKATTAAELAAALYKLPVEMYEYLVNTIEFQPYQGAMKGPVTVIETGAGNDWDTVRLLKEMFAASGISSTDYAAGRVVETVASAEDLVGVKNVYAVKNVLDNAGLRPIVLDASLAPLADPQTWAASAAFVSFDHTWLQTSLSVPGAGVQTVKLDPSRKFRDFQPGMGDMLTDVPFNGDGTDGYLKKPREELAYEYYEQQVREHLAKDHPDKTIADVPYDGPIAARVITALPTDLESFDYYTLTTAAAIPESYLHRVRVSVGIPQGAERVTGSYNWGTETTTLTATAGVFTEGMVNKPLVVELAVGDRDFLITEYNSATQVVVQGDATCSSAPFAIPGLSVLSNVADVSRQRITIGSTGTGTLTPHLYLDGVDTATSTHTVASGAAIKVVVQHLPGTSGGWSSPYSRVYARPSDRWLAVGLDARQFSEELLVDARRKVNDAAIVKANGGTPATDDLVGGLLQLTLLNYFGESDRGEEVVCGLTGAVPVYNTVASGLATATTTLQATPDLDLQIPYLPVSMGLDVPSNDWSSLSIDAGTSGDVARDKLMGYTNSSMEAAVWEEVANTPSISTIKSFQYAAAHGIPLETLHGGNIGQIGALLSAITPVELHTAVCSAITAFVGQGYYVRVPVANTPIDKSNGEKAPGDPGFDTQNYWNGVGYMLIAGAGTGNERVDGYIIHGQVIRNGVAEPIQAYGGAPASLPNLVPEIPTKLASAVVGDPITIANGNVMHEETDLMLPNLGAPLGFSRHYDSFNTVATGQTAWSDRGMSEGWSFSYSDTLSDSTDPNDPVGTKVWFTSDGIRLKFLSNGSGGYITPEGLYGTMTYQSGVGYTWTDKTGGTVKFNDGGRLLEVLDRYQCGVRASYNGSNLYQVKRVLNGSIAAPECSLTFGYTGSHITSIGDSTGRTWTYEYNGNGRLWRVTAPSDSQTPQAVVQYSYYDDDANPNTPDGPALAGLLKQVTDPRNNATTYSYYANRRGRQVTDAEGNRHSLSYNLFRNRVAFVDERNVTTQYTHNDQGNLVEELYADRARVAHQWDKERRMATVDAYGQMSTYHYDGNGNVTTAADQMDRVTRYDEYTSFSDPKFITTMDVSSTVTNVSFSSLANYELMGGTATIEDGGATLRLTGHVGRCISLPSAYAVTANTVVAFDFYSSRQGWVHSLGFDSDQVWTGSQQTHVQVYGTNTTFGSPQEFNSYASGAGQTKHYVVPIGKLIAGGTYGILAFINWASDPAAESVFSNIRVYEAVTTLTSYTYREDDGSLTGVTDALGNLTSYTYATTGNRGLPETMTRPRGTATPADPNDYKTTYTYNNAGQVQTQATRVSASETITVSYGYDARGNMTSSTDGNLKVTDYTYDLLGRRKTRTLPDPDGAGPLARPVTTWTYDAMGNVLSETLTTAGPQRRTAFVYDKMQRVLEVRNADDDPEGSEVRDGTYRLNRYDPAGNLVLETDELGRITEQVYDLRNRPIATVRADGSVVRTGYDGGSRVVRSTDARGNTVQYEYDRLGRKLKDILPDPDGAGPLGTATTRYGYDVRGNLQYVSDPLATYLGDPNHSTEYVYDVLGRKTREILADPDGAGPLGRPSTWFGYDGNGNMNHVTDARGGYDMDAAHSTWYVYDEMDRKTRDILPDPDGAGPLGEAITRYFYDANSNLRYVVDPRGTGALQPSYTTEYVYDALNRKTQEIQRDPDGDGVLTRPTTTWVYDAAGNVASMTDPRGKTTRYNYDLRGRHTCTTDALGNYLGDPTHSQFAWYDAAGNVLVATDALGRATGYEYDARNRKVREILPDPKPYGDEPQQSNPQTTWTYDAAGNLASVTDALGYTTWYQYDGWNRGTHVTDALGWTAGDPQHTSVTRYDAAGNIAAVTDALGRTIDYEYDNLRRKTQEQLPDPDGAGPQGRPTTYFGYDAVGNLKWTTEPRGSTRLDSQHTTWQFYDMWNRAVCTIDALGQDWTESAIPDAAPSSPAHSVVTTYDVVGNVVGMSDELGRTTTYQYDNLGRRLKEIQPDPDGGGVLTSPETTYAYDANGNLTSTSDPLSHVTWEVYDDLNRRIRTVDALGSGPDDLGHATITVYDAVGNVVSVTDPEENTTSYAYDRLNRVVAETDPLQNTTCFEYDAAGNLAEKTDRNGRVTEYTYDPVNRLTEEHWVGEDRTTTRFYDSAGQLYGVEAPGATYFYEHDACGRVTKERICLGELNQPDPELWPWRYSSTYPPPDGDGFQVLLGDKVAFKLSSNYAATLLVVSPSGQGYRADTVLVDQTPTYEASLSIRVDKDGTLKVWMIPQQPLPPDPEFMITKGYADFPSTGGQFDRAYDAAGNLFTSQYGGDTTTYTYDLLDRMETITQDPRFTYQPTKHVRLEYNAAGQPVRIARYRGTDEIPSNRIAETDYAYDPLGRLTGMEHEFANTRSYTWKHDAAGRITQMVSSADGTNNYAMDTTDQLLTADLTGEDYEYDANGNRRSSGATAWITGAANRVFSDGTYTYAYDLEGNRTQRFVWTDDGDGVVEDPEKSAITEYEWDYRNRLEGVTERPSVGGAATRTVEYTYDAFDRRVRRGEDTDGDGPYTMTYTNNVYDGDRLAYEGAPAVGLGRRYLYGPAADQVLAVEDSGSGDVLWGLADHEGTIRDVVYYTNGSLVNHVKYDSFGKAVESTAPIADFLFGFTGQRYDLDTGLYDYGKRWYDAALGRFLSEDPWGFDAGDMNLYRYCGNNPVNNIDPDGLCTVGFMGNVAMPLVYQMPTYQPDPFASTRAALDEAYYRSPAVQEHVSQISSYAGQLAWARQRIDWGIQSARQEAAEAWFFPGSAHERSTAGMKAGYQMDEQIEQLRQYLVTDAASARGVLGDKWESRVQDSLAFKNAIMARARSASWWYQGHGIGEAYSPLDLAAALAAGIVTAPAAITTSVASKSMATPAIETSQLIIGAESRAMSQAFVGAGIGDSGALIVDSLLAPNVVSTLGAQSLGRLTWSISTASPSISSGLAGNILKSLAASQAARQAGSGFTRYYGTETLYNLAYNVNAQLAANPALARTVLSQEEYAAAQQSVGVAWLQYGNAVERRIRDVVRDPSTQYNSMFKHVGGPGKTDFIGVGRFEGLNWDITTNTTRQYLEHIGRSYHPIVIPYTRPTKFTTFP